MELKIEPMLEKHVAAVVALERGCGLSSRGKDGYLKLLQDEQWLLLVAHEASQVPQVVGIFSGLMVVDELQIDNIAVVEDCRQKGVATNLLANALERASQKGMSIATLEVRANNFAALKLYERHEFAIVGRRKDYYRNPPDDALLMSLNLGKHS